MAKVVQITAENFETEVAQASETRAVAVLFSSAEYPDCAPYSQLLGSLSTSMDFTLGVVSCDERENMQLIQAFRVRSVPEVHIQDFQIDATLTNNYTDGLLKTTAWIYNSTGSSSGEYTVELSLYNDGGTEVIAPAAQKVSGIGPNGAEKSVHFEMRENR